MNKQEVIEECKGIIVYTEAIKREQNRGIIKLLIRDEIARRANKIIKALEG